MMSHKKKSSKPEHSVFHSPNSGRQLNLIMPFFCIAILILLTYFTFRSAFNNQFVNWDDQVYLEENSLVLNKEYSKLWKTPVSLNYHPVTMVSLAVQVPKNIKKLTPEPFIRFNVWVHIINSILVFLLVWLLTQQNWLYGLLTSVIFAIHPMHAESVVWVSERKDVLYSFFFLLSCIMYWQYLEGGRKKWLLFAGLLFILSILSKAMAVVIPLVWFLLDYWKKGKLIDRKLIIEKIPFLAISLFFGLMAINVQSGGDFGGLLTLYGEKTKALADPEIFSIWQRIQFAAYGSINYIIKFFYPSEICAFYPYPNEGKFSLIHGLVYPFLFIVLLGLSLWSTLKTRIVLFSIGFYFVTVVFVLQFISVGLAIMADRYTYIPYIGLAFLIVIGVGKLIENQSNIIKLNIAGIAVIWIVSLLFKTRTQVEVWQNSESLWTQVLQYFPKEDLALSNRGNYRGKTGNISGAMEDFELAVSDGCNRADVYEGLGNSYGTMSERLPNKKQDYVNKAIEMYQKALTIEPTKGNIHYNLGVAQIQTNPEASVSAFQEAIKLMPYKEKEILPLLGLCQLNSGKFSEAVQILTKSIDGGNNTDMIYYHRGLAFLQMQNKDAAKNDFAKALEINPNNQEVRLRLKEM